MSIITSEEYSDIDFLLEEEEEIDRVAKRSLRSFNNNKKTLKQINKALTKVDIMNLWRELGICEKE